MPNKLDEVFDELKIGTEEMAEGLAKSHLVRSPYTILFKNLDDEEHSQDDIVIIPGNPPTIIINQAWVLWCLAYNKPNIYRRKIVSALEHVHIMQRTLKHPVKLSKAIALRRDAKLWVRTTVPQINTRIDKRYLTFNYSVTVTDTVTETSIELHGDNVEELKETAILRLSKMIFEKEDLEEMYETFQDIVRAKNEAREKGISPSKIVINGDPNSINTKVEY